MSQQPRIQSSPCGPHVPGIFRTPWIPGLQPSQGVGESSGGSPWVWGQGKNSCSGKGALSPRCLLFHPQHPLYSPPTPTPVQKNPGSAATLLPHWVSAQAPLCRVPLEDLRAWGLHRREPVGAQVTLPQATGHWRVRPPTPTPPRERKLPLCSPRRGQARLARH